MTLFTRTGDEFNGEVGSDDKGRPVRYVSVACDRCCVVNGQRLWIMGTENGQPYSRTGFDCWTCGNTGVRGERKERLYTAKELERVNKAAATREAKRQAAAVQAAAERADREAAYRAQNADFFAKISTLCTGNGSDFWDELAASLLLALKSPSERQIALVEGEIAKRQQNASSAFFGEVGQRMTITLTVERVITLESQFYGTTWITVGRTPEGNVVTYKGKTDLGNKGDTTTVTATIKGHTTYKEIRQTEIQRPKVLEAA